MKALIDGDIIVYRTAWASVGAPSSIAKARARETLTSILESVGASEYKIYISDSGVNNFRTKLFPAYKANRPVEKPPHYEDLINYLLSKFDTDVAFEEEADDALGIEQCSAEAGTTVICTIDKDLLQIPGNHFNWVKNEKQEVSAEQGLWCFYRQLLVGDSTDNITVSSGLSCPGIGEKKARQVLEGATTELDMFKAVRAAYYSALNKDFHPDVIDARILLTGQLVKIRTKADELWTFPKEQ